MGIVTIAIGLILLFMASYQHVFIDFKVSNNNDDDDYDIMSLEDKATKASN